MPTANNTCVCVCVAVKLNRSHIIRGDTAVAADTLRITIFRNLSPLGFLTITAAAPGRCVYTHGVVTHGDMLLTSYLYDVRRISYRFVPPPPPPSHQQHERGEGRALNSVCCFFVFNYNFFFFYKTYKLRRWDFFGGLLRRFFSFGREILGATIFFLLRLLSQSYL